MHDGFINVRCGHATINNSAKCAWTAAWSALKNGGRAASIMPHHTRESNTIKEAIQRKRVDRTL
jgi:hypothetical protein